MIKFFSLFVLLISQISYANYSYNKLRFMDYNELRQIKNGAVNASRKYQYPRQAEKALNPLKETMTMLLSRPNDDNVVSSLITDIESELESLGAYEKTIQTIVDESLKRINDKKLSSEVRTTSALCINNLLLEIKPKSLKNPELAKVICKLADQNVKIPSDI
jgi:predicted ATP-grasp superfamily ATP-dependent carboligase